MMGSFHCSWGNSRVAYEKGIDRGADGGNDPTEHRTRMVHDRYVVG